MVAERERADGGTKKRRTSVSAAQEKSMDQAALATSM